MVSVMRVQVCRDGAMDWFAAFLNRNRKTSTVAYHTGNPAVASFQLSPTVSFAAVSAVVLDLCIPFLDATLPSAMKVDFRYLSEVGRTGGERATCAFPRGWWYRIDWTAMSLASTERRCSCTWVLLAGRAVTLKGDSSGSCRFRRCMLVLSVCQVFKAADGGRGTVRITNAGDPMLCSTAVTAGDGADEAASPLPSWVDVRNLARQKHFQKAMVR